MKKRKRVAGDCVRLGVIGLGGMGQGHCHTIQEIAELRINLEDQRHVRPRSAVMDGCRGVLSAKIEEY